MNIDIVTSDRAEDREKLVRYGEPEPEAVFAAALGFGTCSSESLGIIKAIIEEIEDEYWEILSLEFGQDEQPASVWSCSDYIGNQSQEELHASYEQAIKEVRAEYYRRLVDLVTDDS